MPPPSLRSMTDGVPTWEEVARDHGRLLYAVAYRLAGNSEDAQDLVQDALLRIRRGLETYRPGSLEGWLARIVTNVFLDDVRRKRRRPTVALAPGEEHRCRPPRPPTWHRRALRRGAGGPSTPCPRSSGRRGLCDVADLAYDDICGSARRADRNGPVAHPPGPSDAPRDAERGRGESGDPYGKGPAAWTESSSPRTSTGGVPPGAPPGRGSSGGIRRLAGRPGVDRAVRSAIRRRRGRRSARHLGRLADGVEAGVPGSRGSSITAGAPRSRRSAAGRGLAAGSAAASVVAGSCSRGRPGREPVGTVERGVARPRRRSTTVTQLAPVGVR